MKKTITIKVVSLCLAAAATLASFAASAVSYDSYWYANRYNTAGTTTGILPPHRNHFCYLSRVGVRETDTSTELAQCTVRRSGTVWILEATLGRSSDADAFCQAICYNN